MPKNSGFTGAKKETRRVASSGECCVVDWRTSTAELRSASKINERYLEALAQGDDDTTLQELTQRLEQPRRWNGQRVRALRPFRPEDQAWLPAVSRGEFLLNGFRNADLQKLFWSKPTSDLQERRQRSAQVSRRLRLLRAHGIIRKVARAHRYHVTDYGRQAIAAILAAEQATLNRLIPKAA